MFDQKQMQEFKEAFGLMDQDRDGSISLDDLKEVYSSLGKAPKDTELKQMLEETGGPVNFAKLLTLFGDRLNGCKSFCQQSNYSISSVLLILGTDAEDILMNAFKTFDGDSKGFIHRDK
jgi:Ca2+-binding EF-hand superfamily protein